VRGIVFADINEQGAKEAAEQSKQYATHAEYRAVVVQVDVTNVESVQAMVNTAVEEFGRIDYSIHSAGVRLVLASHGRVSKRARSTGTATRTSRRLMKPASRKRRKSTPPAC
jgi:NAD(P)-dependent dehydrogenase (short-subunit alcohol dehydrogenase family)